MRDLSVLWMDSLIEVSGSVVVGGVCVCLACWLSCSNAGGILASLPGNQTGISCIARQIL